MKYLFQLFFRSVMDVAPLLVVIFFFQFVVIGESFPNTPRMLAGIALVITGLFLFMRGLEMALFPLGESLAFSFAEKGDVKLLLAFAVAIGYSATVAEPALLAVAEKAELITHGRLTAFALRNTVAAGVAFGIALGTIRIILGHPIHYYFIGGYTLVMALTAYAPKDIVGLAYDMGGVTTSTVTVPLVTALGVGLASSISGRNPLIDGFGLVAFAAMTPMATVMVYGIAVL
ncbi:MAG: DUF1538 domain-containing protein [Nitrospinota bacterium]|nr:DUF1538 domain-containing protein [Nitrospinota bacterium]